MIRYKTKFETIIQNTVFELLEDKEKRLVRDIAFYYKLTHQDLKFLCEVVKDLSTWDIDYIRDLSLIFDFKDDFSDNSKNIDVKNPKEEKKKVLSKLKAYHEELKCSKKEYVASNKEISKEEYKEENKEISIENLKCVKKDIDASIFSSCPVYSEKTICCGLKTLDVVQNCPFNCSYCTIQTFYGEDFIFVNNLKEKLATLNLDKKKLYHIGTGQSSDALVWGNKFNVLDALVEFANKNQNVLLELKTKSSNIKYFKSSIIPKNIVCSWSLNTQKVISNEELGTAPLKERLAAAKMLALLGIKVAFHFHPIIYYAGWEEEYKELVDCIESNFSPNDISFISFGSLTFIKPVIKKIREKKIKTKILQMPMAHDPNGKITYPTDLKIKLYKTLYNYFEKFHNKTYFYLCMETREIWEEVFGFCYKDNDAFLKDFLKKTLKF
ncbi:MAG: radical SAM protein [Bdellovibrionota bacterium]